MRFKKVVLDFKYTTKYQSVYDSAIRPPLKLGKKFEQKTQFRFPFAAINNCGQNTY